LGEVRIRTKLWETISVARGKARPKTCLEQRWWIWKLRATEKWHRALLCMKS